MQVEKRTWKDPQRDSEVIKIVSGNEEFLRYLQVFLMRPFNKKDQLLAMNLRIRILRQTFSGQSLQ
jgi:hypothetical protein